MVWFCAHGYLILRYVAFYMYLALLHLLVLSRAFSAYCTFSWLSTTCHFIWHVLLPSRLSFRYSMLCDILFSLLCYSLNSGSWIVVFAFCVLLPCPTNGSLGFMFWRISYRICFYRYPLVGVSLYLAIFLVCVCCFLLVLSFNRHNSCDPVWCPTHFDLVMSPRTSDDHSLDSRVLLSVTHNLVCFTFINLPLDTRCR